MVKTSLFRWQTTSVKMKRLVSCDVKMVNMSSISLVPTHIVEELIANSPVFCKTRKVTNTNVFMWNVQELYWHCVDNYEEVSQADVSLKSFALQLFKQLPWCQDFVAYDTFCSINRKFMAYLRKLPTAGAILISSDGRSVLLVQGCIRHYWSFPKGKRDPKDRNLYSCACREVLEETSFDINKHQFANRNEFIQVGSTTLFIVWNVSLKTEFKARRKNEIEAFQWVKFDELPILSKLPEYKVVRPFVPKLMDLMRDREKTYLWKRNNQRAQG